MTTEKQKPSLTFVDCLGASVAIIAILGAIGGCFKLYFDVQLLKDISRNQQADIYQLERKIKELSTLNSAMINQMALPAQQKKKLTDQIEQIQIDWYRHSNSGRDETKAMLPDYGKQQ